MTNEADIKHVITTLLNDSNGTFMGGCAECGNYLQDKYHFTDNQQAAIEYRLYALAKYIDKHIKR